MCAHTQSHTHMPKLRGTLPPPQKKCTNGIRDSQTGAHTGMCTHICAKAGRHTDPFYKQDLKHTNMGSHRPRLADTPTPTNTQTGSDTQTHTHRNIQMCMCPWGHIQAQNTLKKCPNTHILGRTALNSTAGGCAGRGENKRSLP